MRGSKTTIATLVVMVLVAFAAVGYRSCNLYDENSILKGRDAELTSRLEESIDVLSRYRDENTALLTQLKIQEGMATEAIDAANDAAETMIGGLRTIEQLKANTDNDYALITELQIEIGKRDELIEKLVFTIKVQQERYFGLTKQYTIVKRELDLSKIVIEDQASLLKVKDLRIGELEKSLKSIRFGSTLKGGLAVGLALAVVYGLVT